MTRTTPTRGRKLLLALHVAALAACGWLLGEIASDAEPAHAAAHVRADEPGLILEPGEWIFDGANFAPNDSETAKAAPLAPMPASAPRVAVRVCAGHVSAELYGPVSVPEVVDLWRAAGWAVTESRTDDRPRFDLRRDGRALTAWLLKSRTEDTCHLLIVPAKSK